MKSGYENLYNLIPNPKTVNARATFRVTRPKFADTPLTDSLGITDPSKIDSCAYGTGILRVTNYNNLLYTQNIQDINAPWPAWVNTGIALKPLSRPGADGGYVWYQKADNNIAWRNFANWAVETIHTSNATALVLAPINNLRCYGMTISAAKGAQSLYFFSPPILPYKPTTFSYLWPGRVYNISDVRLDAVCTDTGQDYLYFSDRESGRIVEMSMRYATTTWGVPKPIISIDAIDDVYGLNLDGASYINGQVVVTGRMTRTSDAGPYGMDIYLLGPRNFSLGREMYVSYVRNGGPMLAVGDQLVAAGATSFAKATITKLFGVDTASLKLTTSDIVSLQMNEVMNRSSTLSLNLSPALSHAAITPGSQVQLEIAYNDIWMTVFTGEIETIGRSKGEGQDLMVNIVHTSSKRLAQWAPEQGIYIPSQAYTIANATDMSQIIRATNKWTEGTDGGVGTLQPSKFNTWSVLYTAGRPSRGGIMRARFWNEGNIDATRNSRFGVGLNYYRESKIEAATRLGLEYDQVDDELCGHNGLVAIYGQREHNNAPGLALFLWQNSAFTYLTSAALTLAAGWQWIDISFTEGIVYVRTRLDGHYVWATPIIYSLSTAGEPWVFEQAGRGCVLMNRTLGTSTTFHPVSAGIDTLAVDSHASFPASGTVLLDDEQITYNGKSAATPPSGVPQFFWKPAVRITSGATPTGFPVPVMVNGWSGVDDAYNGLAARVFETPGPWPPVADNGDTYRVVDYVNGSRLETWEPNSQATGWDSTIGVAADGYWLGPATGSVQMPCLDRECSIGYLSDWGGMLSNRGIWIRPALYVTARGANGTHDVRHSGGTLYLVKDINLRVSQVECFTQEEDIRLADALKSIVRLTGGQCATAASLETTLLSVAPNNEHWVVAPQLGQDFVVEFDVPDGYSNAAGIIFRASAPFVAPASAWAVGAFPGVASAYILSVYGTGEPNGEVRVYLNQVVNGSVRSAGELNFLNGYVRASCVSYTVSGRLRISVQGDRFSVWLNDVYLYTFRDASIPTGAYGAVGTLIPNSYNRPMAVRISELSDLLADITVGVRGKGMNILSELTQDRKTHFRCEPDGSLYFFKNPAVVDASPDIVISEHREQVDDRVSRVRVEGIKINEVMDPVALNEVGNLFETINSKYADTLSELSEDGQIYMQNLKNTARTITLETVMHPGLQPGDKTTFILDGAPELVTVTGIQTSLGYNGNNFEVNQTIQGYYYE